MCCVTPNQSLPFLKPVLMTHKVIETIALSFHLIEAPLRRYANAYTYQFFQEIHISSHKIEPLLHFMCFLGDATSLLSDVSNGLGLTSQLKGGYVEYKDKRKTQIDVLKTAGKVCHTFSHFLSSASLLTDNLRVVNLTKLKPLFNYQTILSVLGYGFWSASVIWKRFRGDQDKQFKLNLGIYVGGFVAESLTLGKSWKQVTIHPRIHSAVSQIETIAGMIHCMTSISAMTRHQHSK